MPHKEESIETYSLYGYPLPPIDPINHFHTMNANLLITHHGY